VIDVVNSKFQFKKFKINSRYFKGLKTGAEVERMGQESQMREVPSPLIFFGRKKGRVRKLRREKPIDTESTIQQRLCRE
jgi:hypothetical protein